MLTALRPHKQFLVWKSVPDPMGGKPLKIPVNFQTGVQCDAHEATNWTTYENAAAMVALVGGTGVGFVLTPIDPICCIDLDKCLQADGTWNEFATYILSLFPDAAVELSYSGDGLHLWFQYDLTQVPANHKTRTKDVEGLEIYTSRRFIALGSHVFRGSSAPDYTVMLNQVLAYYLPGTTAEGADWTDHPVPEWSGPEDDDELIAKMLGSKQSAAAAFGGKASFQDLWECNIDVLEKTYPSPQGDAFGRSEADAALCSHLAFWTGKNCERMDRLFRRSGLMRPKYETRADYRMDTITKACGWTTEVYSKSVKAKTADAGPTFPQHCLAVDGLLGEICMWIDATAPKPQPILTLAAVLPALGALFGGRYAITPLATRTNLYTCGILPTGGGKDHPRKCLINLFEAARAGKYVMGSDVTSDSAISKALERNPSQVGFFDEIGLLMQELNGGKAASHKAGILSMLMKLYSSSGSTFKGTEYADRKRERVDIQNPCLCIYGTTTPNVLYEAFSSKDTNSGHLNRWLFFQGDLHPEPSKLDFSGKTNVKPPPHLVEAIQSIVASIAFESNQGDIDVNISDDAQSVFDEVWFESQSERPLWIRYFENMAKVAGILAIADNRLNPVVCLSHAQWARDLVKWCIKVMVHDVNRYVADGPYQKQCNRILNLITAAGLGGITLSEISRRTTSMKADDRNPVLEHLVVAELVELEEEAAEGTRKPVRRYRSINP